MMGLCEGFDQIVLMRIKKMKRIENQICADSIDVNEYSFETTVHTQTHTHAHKFAYATKW